jgi:hypothetical protein
MSIRTCPECHSERVVTTYEQLVDANTFDHWCHSVKPHDPDSKAMCLKCNWTGERKDLEGDDE